MPKILVTGGNGYVGGRIVRALQASSPMDLEVRIGSRTARNESNQVITDFTDFNSLSAACKGVDIVLHLAAMNEIDAVQDPAAALLVNGVGTAYMLQAAIQNGVKRFLYMSTAHVYGSPLQGYIDEETPALPMHPYATSHRAAEDVVLVAHHNKQIEGMVVRLSNSFGAPISHNVNRWTLLINDLCQQAIKNKSLTLKSSGMQRRDFIPLSDVTSAIQHLLRLNWKEFKNPTFNLGGNWSPTVYEVACLVSDCCSHALKYKPNIERPMPSAAEKTEDLIYSIKKLLSTGYVLTGNARQEIIDTLKICADAVNESC